MPEECFGWKFDFTAANCVRCSLPAKANWYQGSFEPNQLDEWVHNARWNPGDADAIRGLQEIGFLHRIILDQPDYFFQVDKVLWAYTGGAGEAPDFLGLDNGGNPRLGEVKWGRGWHAELPGQIGRYLDNLFRGDCRSRKMIVDVACTQTADRALINQLVGVVQDRQNQWGAVDLRFGFIQIGTCARNGTESAQKYLRVVWVSGDAWNRHDFVGHENQIGLHGE